MSNDIFSFIEIKNAYDITADVLFAFQGEMEKNKGMLWESVETADLDVSRARADLGFDVVCYILGGGVIALSPCNN